MNTTALVMELVWQSSELHFKAEIKSVTLDGSLIPPPKPLSLESETLKEGKIV